MAKAEQVSAIVIVVFQCWRHVKESVPGRAAGATAARPCARQSVAGAGEGEWGCGVVVVGVGGGFLPALRSEIMTR